MKLPRPIPLHLACAKKKTDGGYPDPLWTGTHLIATNGRILVATDVELDDDTDPPKTGYVPKEVLDAAVKRLPKGDDADTAELHIDIGAGGAKAIVFEGAVETFSAQAEAANLCVAAPSNVPGLIPPRTTARLLINAKQLAKLAQAMGSDWVSIYVHIRKDGEITPVARVEPELPAGACEHVVGSIFIGESERARS